MAHDRTGDFIIDCDTCTVRGLACDDCVVTVLLADPPGRAMDGAQPAGWVALDPVEAQALDALAEGGLLPPLRLTPRTGTG
jgi:hypothetical protein